MSYLSGKCDLMDHIERTGNLLKDFEAFKKETNGVIYQHKKITIKEWFDEKDFDFIKEHCNFFDYTKNIQYKSDKRCKDGIKSVITYSFKYANKDYDFVGMKKKGIYIEVPIYFNTLLDLLPYLPYLISIGCGGHIVITNESYVDTHRDDSLESAHDSLMFKNYKKELADLYLKVCEKYFLYKKEERIRRIPLFGYKPLHNGYYEILVNEPIDYMHDPKFVWEDGKTRSHWQEPIIEDSYTLLVSENDIDFYLKDSIKKAEVWIQYVAKPEDGFPE